MATASMSANSRKRPRDPAEDSLQHDHSLIPLEDLYASSLADPSGQLHTEAAAPPSQDAIDQFSRAINLDSQLDPALNDMRGAEGSSAVPEIRIRTPMEMKLHDPTEQAHGRGSQDGQNGDTTFDSAVSDDMGGEDGHLGVPDDESKKFQPFSRSPELRVSHKLAERKRRKEMKDLFDELRDLLPDGRASKSSKYDILTRSIEYIGQLKQQNNDKTRETDRMRRDLDIARGGTGVGYPAPAPTYQAYPVGGLSGINNGYAQGQAPQASVGGQNGAGASAVDGAVGVNR